MKSETSPPYRRFLTSILGVLLALPIAYAASSGPVLRLSDESGNSGKEQTGEIFYRVEGRDTIGMRIRSCYQPLFQAAMATHLEAPLFAYLRAWSVFPMRMGHGHIFVVVLSKPVQPATVGQPKSNLH